MKRRMMAVYALVGALAASPILTSCVDDSESAEVTALRDAKLEQLKAELQEQILRNEQDNALAKLRQEQKQIANDLQKSEIARQEAANAVILAENALKKARLEKENEVKLAELEKELEQAKQYAEQAKLNAQQQKLQAEQALATAEMELKKAMLDKELQLKNTQERFDKYVADLDARERAKLNQMQQRVNALMKGGTYQYTDEYGNPQTVDYSGTSILQLTQSIANHQMNLLKFENNLVDHKAWMEETITDKQGEIAVQKALIEKYKELAKDNSEASIKKTYEDAVAQYNSLSEASGSLDQAVTLAYQKYQSERNKLYSTNDILLNWDVLSPWDGTKFIDRYYTNQYVVDYSYTLVNGVKVEMKRWYGNQFQIDDYQQKNLQQKLKEAADAVTEAQRELAVKKAAVVAAEKAIADKKLTDAYKTALKAAQDAVAAAKKAFEEDANDTNKYNLESAEATLANFDASMLNDENLALETAKTAVTSAEEVLATKVKDQEKYQKYEKMLAPENVKALNEAMAALDELEKDNDAKNAAYNENRRNKDYYYNLLVTLSNFAYPDADFNKLIANCEKEIKGYEDYIKEINDCWDNGQSLLKRESIIALEKVELAADEALLKIRQAEYDAALAELNAKLESMTKK